MTFTATLGVYEFVYRAEERITMPSFWEGIWHRVFGRALRELSCVSPAGECEECLLRQQCDYVFLFKGMRPDEAEMMRKYNTIPVPHVFGARQVEPDTIEPGKFFAQSLVLVGKANERLPMVIRAMAAVGAAGFGRDRAKAELMEVVQSGPPGHEPRPILEQGRMVAMGAAHSVQIPPIPEVARIQFLSPYLPSGDMAKTGRFDLSRFFMAIVRRVSMMHYFYMGGMLKEDFKHLKQIMAQTEVIELDLTPCRGFSYAARQGKRIPMHGLQGHIDFYTKNIEELWQYLYIGQWLHLGKKASMGFGGYQLFKGVAE